MGLLIVQFADICAGFIGRHLDCPEPVARVIVSSS